MAKGGSDVCVKAGGRRTGVGVTLEPLPTSWGQAAKFCCAGAKGLPLHRAQSSLALSAHISAPDSLVLYRLALRLFYVTLGMKYM